jgi:hypothetical protein
VPLKHTQKSGCTSSKTSPWGSLISHCRKEKAPNPPLESLGRGARKEKKRKEKKRKEK